jgi:hypothetical protein
MQQHLGQILRAIDVASRPEGLEDRNLKARLPCVVQVLGKTQPLVAGAKLGGPDEDHIGAAPPSRTEHYIAPAAQNAYHIILCQKSQICHDDQNIPWPSLHSLMGDKCIEGIIQIQLRLYNLDIAANVCIVQPRPGEDSHFAKSGNSSQNVTEHGKGQEPSLLWRKGRGQPALGIAPLERHHDPNRSMHERGYPRQAIKSYLLR